MKKPVWFLLVLGAAILTLAVMALSQSETPASEPARVDQTSIAAQTDPSEPEVRAPDVIKAPPDDAGEDNPSIASSGNNMTGDDDRFASPSVAGAIRQTYTEGLSWGNAGSEDLDPLIGDTFTVRMPDGRVIDLVLSEVTLGPEDPARPDILQRRRSVFATLTADPDVLATLNDYGTKPVAISHPGIGSAEVMLGIYPTETGDKFLEFVLN